MAPYPNMGKAKWSRHAIELEIRSAWRTLINYHNLKIPPSSADFLSKYRACGPKFLHWPQTNSPAILKGGITYDTVICSNRLCREFESLINVSRTFADQKNFNPCL